MYQHILCAIDLEIGTEHILQHGAALSGLTGARLTLLFVVDSPLLILSAGYGPLKLPEDQAEALGQAEQSLRMQAEAHLRALASRFAPEAEILVLEGPPIPERVLETLEKRSVDLLVVGSHGNRAIRRLLVGSVCHKLVQRAPIPVLVVKPAGLHGVKNLASDAEG